MCCQFSRAWSPKRCVRDAEMMLAPLGKTMASRFFMQQAAADKRRQKQLEAQKRYKERHRERVLAKKRAYANRPETLARRRYFYERRRDPPKPSPYSSIPSSSHFGFMGSEARLRVRFADMPPKK